MKSQAVLFAGLKQIVVADVQLPEPGPEDVIVDVHYSSISVGTERWCLTGQLKGFAEPFPHAPGYQAAGVVREVGRAVTALKPGDRAFSIASKAPRDWRGSWWGGHVRHHVTDQHAVYRLPDSVALADAAGLLLAQVGYNGAARPTVTPGDTVLIIGDGQVGQYAGQVFRHRGATVILAGHHDSRLATAQQFSAADVTINSHRQDVAEFVRKRHPGGLPVTVETAGKSALVKLCVELTVYDGQFVLLGYYPDGECVIDTHWVRAKETTVHCPNSSTPKRLAATLDLLAAGKMKVKELVTHEFNYREAPRAYGMMLDPAAEFLGMMLRWVD